MSCPFLKTYTNPHYKALKRRWIESGVSPYGELTPFDLAEWHSYLRAIPLEESVVRVPCGTCLHCRRARASSWKVRLTKEARDTRRMRKPLWITLQIAPEHYDFVHSDPSLAIRRFLERFRKRFGRSLKHWFIAEYGKNSTKRLHFHGFIWNLPYDCTWDDIRLLWSYGYVRIDDKLTIKRIAYATKYSFKDMEDSSFNPDEQPHSGKVWTSPGVGKAYLQSSWSSVHHQPVPDNSLPYQWYIIMDGFKYTLPKYYRDRLFTEEERKYMRMCMSLSPPPDLIWFGKQSFISAEALADWLLANPRFAGENKHLITTIYGTI